MFGFPLPAQKVQPPCIFLEFRLLPVTLSDSVHPIGILQEFPLLPVTLADFLGDKGVTAFAAWIPFFVAGVGAQRVTP